MSDACGAKRGFLVAGTSCQIDMPCARALKGPCGDNRMAGIGLVGGTQAGHCRARSAERGGKRSRVGKSPAVDGLDTAGLKEASCKRGAGREVGGRAEIGEEDFWPCPGLRQDGVRLVAQR